MDKEILEVSLRIELQLKAIWWDNLMYICWISSALLAFSGWVASKIVIAYLAFFWLLLGTIIIQVVEYFDKKDIRKKYEKRNINRGLEKS